MIYYKEVPPILFERAFNTTRKMKAVGANKDEAEVRINVDKVRMEDYVA